MPRGKFDRKKLQDAGEYKMNSATFAKVEKLIAKADEEIEETRVNFRWGKDQLDLVKRAAKQIGVSYQTYLKQVVYRQCLINLKNPADHKQA
jgi:predicted DNA binding CopG/RHH family protein